MIELSADRINKYSDYQVRQISDKTVEFDTDYGVEYHINFMEDNSVWEENAYQFVIINKNRKSSPNDEKLKQTLFRIIEDFFIENTNILLYICETGDGRQSARSKLFLRWFRNYDSAENFFLQESEGITNYTALIVKRSNPQFTEIVKTYTETIELLKDKPE